MAFWLVEHAGARPEAGELVIEVRPPGSVPVADMPTSAPSLRPGERPAQTVRIKSPIAGEPELVLTVGPDRAEVVAGAATWLALHEPTILAICQSWRFRAIDRELGRLTESARTDIPHATLPRPASLVSRERLCATAQSVRSLLLDLAHFQGPLTDPYPFFTSDRSVQVYRSLAEKLHLEEWCEAIDERAEAVEDTYEAATEKLFEYRNFAWEALLEFIIILILVGELAVLVWDMMTP
jgi:hypothetical protein